jgi:Uma2 family endonuclease
MRTMKLNSSVTVDDLLRCPKDGRKYELVDGEIIVSPAGFRHAEIVAKIVHILATFLETHPIGIVCGDNLGVKLPTGNVRSPDITFVRSEKAPTGTAADGFAEFIPDLAVEVLSPQDSLKEVGRKIGEFLDCGVPVVWLVDPAHKTITVYRSLSQTEQLRPEDSITAEGILPGFSCSVSRFF